MIEWSLMNNDTQQQQEPARIEPESSEKWYQKFKGPFYSVALFVSAFTTALLLNAFVFQPYQVEGSSMEPTLQNSDRLIVTKLGKTWSRITRGNYVPDRGEVVVFKSNRLNKQLIKRVVALPGERVVISNGVLTVYNDEFESGFNPDELIDVSFYENTDGLIDLIVPEDSIYVIGDNRLPNASQDSRSFGPVSSDDIVGVLQFRMYPFNKLDVY